MKINKTSQGLWDNKSTYLDDVAYIFYLDYVNKKNSIKGSILILPLSQYNVIVNQNEHFKKFYHKAKLIIRQEKLNKIKENYDKSRCI